MMKFIEVPIAAQFKTATRSTRKILGKIQDAIDALETLGLVTQHTENHLVLHRSPKNEHLSQRRSSTLIRRMFPIQHPHRPNPNDRRSIHLKRHYRGTSNRCRSQYDRPILSPYKMLVPSLLMRMKKRNPVARFRINKTDPIPFHSITRGTSKT
jgi:hypothetical protein